MELPEALEIPDRNLLPCQCRGAGRSPRCMFEIINFKYIFLVRYCVYDRSFSSVTNFQCLNIHEASCFVGFFFCVELK